MTKFLNPFLSFFNLGVALALLATGIDRWTYTSYQYFGYFVSASICLGLFSVLCGIFLILLEFRYFDGFFHRHTRAIMTPTGRGIVYLFLSILTAGNTWYQILSVIVVIAIGLGFILIYLYEPNLYLTGLIPSHSTSADPTSTLEKGTTGELDSFSREAAPAQDQTTVVYSIPDATEEVQRSED